MICKIIKEAYKFLVIVLKNSGLSMGMSFLRESPGKRPMGWDGTGQHTFVFPMRLRHRMRASECY